jgi:hypothetical protein
MVVLIVMHKSVTITKYSVQHEESEFGSIPVDYLRTPPLVVGVHDEIL